MASPAVKKPEKDAEAALLEHLLGDVGIDLAALRTRAKKLGPKASEHDVSVAVNEHAYGKERAFFVALVRALAGGA